MAAQEAGRDRSGLTILSPEECLERIRSVPLGRVAFTQDGEVVILPVNHLLVGTRFAFQTSWGSVLVRGPVAIVHHREERARLDAWSATTWVPAVDNMFWVVVTPENVSGREIRTAGTSRRPAGSSPLTLSSRHGQQKRRGRCRRSQRGRDHVLTAGNGLLERPRSGVEVTGLQ